MTAGPTAYGEVERELAVLLRRARAWNRDVATEVHPDLQPAAYALLARVDEVGSVRASDPESEKISATRLDRSRGAAGVRPRTAGTSGTASRLRLSPWRARRRRWVWPGPA